MERFSNVLVVLTSLLAVASAQVGTGFNCTAQKTCGTCIGESPDCRWCKTEDFQGERCNRYSLLVCQSGDIVSPQSELTNIKNETPRNALPSSPPIQLAPQEIKIKLRPNEPFQFKMEFRQAENYPVDLYFIMDTSFTMKNYKDTLSNFTEQLVTSIRGITTDFQLGFGSFVDKTMLPFILTGDDNKVVDQCTGTSFQCDLPYGFRNQLRLTTNESEFKRRVSELNISGNLDAPEGGFDAIMQTIVCEDEIGWRDKARKIILFSTDGSFHYAGDGKLGGIVLPNDGICHLTKDGYYSETNNQDYPSINQLAQKISDKKAIVIFMVPEKQVALYSRLSEHILGSSVGQLLANASNVIDLVKENYDRIRSAVELKAEDHGDLQIDFKVQCQLGVLGSKRCERIGIGKIVKFNVTITSDSCPNDPSLWTRTFKIYPVGLTEQLTINLELICECPCELPNEEKRKSEKCNSTGTYECGICTCDRGYYGKKCECGSANAEGDQNDMPCRLKNTSSDVCESRGQCVCGQCECNAISSAQPERRYSGSHCQCNDYNCDYSSGQLCGGPSKGICKCGKCNCNAYYKGDACECLISTAPCKGSNELTCSGNGNCTCGVCQCADAFKGGSPTCDICTSCPEKCVENRDCVVCHFQDNKEQCLRDCVSKNRTSLLLDELTYTSEWGNCSFRDENHCQIHSTYNYKTNVINVNRNKDCPYRASNTVIIVTVIVGVIIIGIIALLIWKVVVTVHDKREYEAFVEDQAKARWDVAQNPVYKPATTNFQNPTYRPGSTINH